MHTPPSDKFSGWWAKIAPPQYLRSPYFAVGIMNKIVYVWYRHHRSTRPFNYFVLGFHLCRRKNRVIRWFSTGFRWTGTADSVWELGTWAFFAPKSTFTEKELILICEIWRCSVGEISEFTSTHTHTSRRVHSVRRPFEAIGQVSHCFASHISTKEQRSETANFVLGGSKWTCRKAPPTTTTTRNRQNRFPKWLEWRASAKHSHAITVELKI